MGGADSGGALAEGVQYDPTARITKHAPTSTRNGAGGAQGQWHHPVNDKVGPRTNLMGGTNLGGWSPSYSDIAFMIFNRIT